MVENQTPYDHFTASSTKTQKCKSELALTQQGIAESRSALLLPSTGLAVPLCTAVVSGPASQWHSVCFSSQAFPSGLQPGQVIHG